MHQIIHYLTRYSRNASPCQPCELLLLSELDLNHIGSKYPAPKTVWQSSWKHHILFFFSIALSRHTDDGDRLVALYKRPPPHTQANVALIHSKQRCAKELWVCDLRLWNYTSIAGGPVVTVCADTLIYGGAKLIQLFKVSVIKDGVLSKWNVLKVTFLFVPWCTGESFVLRVNVIVSLEVRFCGAKQNFGEYCIVFTLHIIVIFKSVVLHRGAGVLTDDTIVHNSYTIQQSINSLTFLCQHTAVLHFK